MTAFSRPGLRARPDWSFVRAGGPGCRWDGADLSFLGAAIGGVQPLAHPWLIDLKALTGALQEVYGPRFALGDRDLLLQRAIDARAEGDRRLAEILADMIRFPPLSYAERIVAVGTLSRALGRKLAFNPRISYQVALPPRLSLAYNDRHWPAGSPGGIGGQFAPRAGDAAITISGDAIGNRVERLRQALDDVPGMTPVAKDAIVEFFIVEGRGDPDKLSGARGGITDDTLRRMRNLDQTEKLRLGLQNVSSLEDLDYARAARLYHAYLDKDALKLSGGIRRLEDIHDETARAALVDTMFAHGRPVGSVLLRQAVSRTVAAMSHDDRTRLGVTHFREENFTNRQLFDVYVKLANGRNVDALRANLADVRLYQMRKQIDGGQAGWRGRINRYR